MEWPAIRATGLNRDADWCVCTMCSCEVYVWVDWRMEIVGDV